MKLEEKLMKLRKKNAWSQEEFAEKLDVTRQTVSKWELGQTTPDTDNLSKIATIFGISVNDLLDESINPIDDNSRTSNNSYNNYNSDNTYNNYNSDNSKNSNNKLFKIFILIIILILVLLGIGAIALNKLFNKITNQAIPKSVIEMFQENSITDIFNEIIAKVKNLKQEASNDTFKNLYYGDVDGTFMGEFLDEIVKSNEENTNKIITLKYKDMETSDAQEIRSVKDKISSDKVYEISYEYDEEGYINKAIIGREKLTDYAINLFNNTFKSLYYGSKNGFFMDDFIDQVIQSNEEHPDNIITVNYNGVVTSNADELRNMKKKFTNGKTYDISYEYDEDGLINKAKIIEL